MASGNNFLRTAGRILNAGQSRALILTGNIHDIFHMKKSRADDYSSLVEYLTGNWNLSSLILIVYELNGPIRFLREKDAEKVRKAWIEWRLGMNPDQLAINRMTASEEVQSQVDSVTSAYDDSMHKAVSNPTLALELMRQMCLCSRTKLGGSTCLKEDLLIVVEGADMLLPDAPITSLNDMDRQRVSICHDWFCDLGFVNGGDSVVMIAESRSQLNQRIARLPQLIEVEVPSPDLETRKHFISWFARNDSQDRKLQLWGTQAELAELTAGLSLHALMQLLKGVRHGRAKLSQEVVVAKVEGFIKSQLGEEVVEFKKPGHSMNDVIGFKRLKTFLKKEVIPRFGMDSGEALPGAAIGGPIGAGKTFIFEAVAAELDMVVLVIKNIRSKYYGETDVIFERLRRVLMALSRVLIFIDEADTQLGGVGADTHATERRLTGKIQSMMSDPLLRGKVVWLLVTARIHLLSPDIRRPGRVGDLIIPVLDPEGKDREAFLDWVVSPVIDRKLTGEDREKFAAATEGWSAAGFAALRSELKAKAKLFGKKGKLTMDEVMTLIEDLLPPAIGETRRYQTLQALVNCTRRSLMPNPDVTDEEREAWSHEIRQLEAKGIR
jgi:hypothetical protein